MRKGGNKMRAKYSVTHYETYSKTVLEVLDEFLEVGLVVNVESVPDVAADNDSSES